MDGDYDDPGLDNTLGLVVDAPNRWIAVVKHQSAL